MPSTLVDFVCGNNAASTSSAAPNWPTEVDPSG